MESKETGAAMGEVSGEFAYQRLKPENRIYWLKSICMFSCYHNRNYGNMNRKELEHIIRAAGEIVKDQKIIILGSQAVLARFPVQNYLKVGKVD